jgi:predicted NBD/HSP70 family sugar kinase
MDKKLFAAIDLGGTKIYSVIADSSGVILADDRQDDTGRRRA